MTTANTLDSVANTYSTLQGGDLLFVERGQVPGSISASALKADIRSNGASVAVAAFGATGSGDETTEFQAAIDALPADGGIITLDAQDYTVTIDDLNVGTKNILWLGENSFVNSARFWGLPGSQRGWDAEKGRYNEQYDIGTNTDGVAHHWAKIFNRDGDDVSTYLMVEHTIENGAVFDTGRRPWTLNLTQRNAATNTDLGDSNGVVIFARNILEPGCDETNAFVCDMQVLNNENPPNPNTEPSINIATRAGGMQVQELNCHRTSAWNDDDDSQSDQAEIFQIGPRSGGEAFAFVNMKERTRAARPWSGIVVSGDGSSGAPIVLPDEPHFSQTDDTWFTAESHWLILDKEDGYADPVTPYLITSYTAASRQIELQTTLPEDIAGKRVSIIAADSYGCFRHIVNIGANTMAERMGVTIRNRSGSQLSEIKSANDYYGPVFDYEGASLRDDDTFMSVPSRADVIHKATSKFLFGVGSDLDMGEIAGFSLKGKNDAGQRHSYAELVGKITDARDGAEDGVLEFKVSRAGSMVEVMQLTSNAVNPVSMFVGGSLKEVTEGSANSGGSGFKVLRVPN